MTDNKKSNVYLIPTEALQTVRLSAPATQFKNYPDVLTVQQIAELMGVCKNTVYKLIKENQLSCRRIGTAIRVRKKGRDVLPAKRRLTRTSITSI